MKQLTQEEGIRLLEQGDILELGQAAGAVRQKLHPGYFFTIMRR